jgi:hypothetical protein
LKLYNQITGYDRPVKFVTIAPIFCYESPDSVVTKHLLRAFVLPIRYESQTEKTETSCNIPDLITWDNVKFNSLHERKLRYNIKFCRERFGPLSERK